MGEQKEAGGPGAAAAARALQQCGQLQKLIDISIASLRGLRTKCAVSNDLTQQEIRTLEVRAGLHAPLACRAGRRLPFCLLPPPRGGRWRGPLWTPPHLGRAFWGDQG